MLLQYCGAHREVVVEIPAAAALAHHMPPQMVADTSKVNRLTQHQVILERANMSVSLRPT